MLDAQTNLVAWAEARPPVALVKLASASSPAEQTAAPLLGSDKPTNMTLMVVVSLSCGIFGGQC